MTKDDKGRWRMGAREWLAFASLSMTLLGVLAGGGVWLFKIHAFAQRAEEVLKRLDSEREMHAAVRQHVTDIDRRMTAIEEFVRANTSIRGSK